MHYAGAARRRGRRHMITEINVTPLVDVMLVLLIIFMVTAPLLTSTVEVDLPRTQAGQARGQDEPLAVTVTADGTVYLQDTQIELEQLIVRLRAIAQERRDQQPRIFVRGDRTINYGRVMEVMGTLVAGGFERVALVTQAPGTQSPTAPRAPGATPPAPAPAAPRAPGTAPATPATPAPRPAAPSR